MREWEGVVKRERELDDRRLNPGIVWTYRKGGRLAKKVDMNDTKERKDSG